MDNIAGASKVTDKGSSVRKASDAAGDAAESGMCFVAGTLVLTSCGAIPIEELEVGQRVLTPSEDSATAVDRESWVLLDLEIPGSATLGDEVNLRVLRPTEWAIEVGAFFGEINDFELPEMGVRGRARVKRISPCPPIDAGSGRIVLATVTSRSNALIELMLPHENSLKLTEGHRLYSEETGEWSRAVDLQSGTRLRALSGPVPIKETRRVPSERFVYNIEVETDHSYLVGVLGVLSHNVGGGGCGTGGAARPHTPGKGHRRKSDPKKQEKFNKKQQDKKGKEQQDYDTAKAEWDEMSAEARKIRPEKNPDNLKKSKKC